MSINFIMIKEHPNAEIDIRRTGSNNNLPIGKLIEAFNPEPTLEYRPGKILHQQMMHLTKQDLKEILEQIEIFERKH